MNTTSTKYPNPILVTGATGTVGSRLIPRMIAEGDKVRALVRDPESETALKLRAAGAELVVGDLTELDTVGLKPIVEGTSAVIHLAAAFRGGETVEQSTAINTDGAIALARAAVDAGVSRFVFISTNLVYGADHADVQDETTEFRPLGWPTPYPAAKVAAEEALQKLHAEHGAAFDLRIVRLAFVYGDGDPHIEEFLQRGLLDWHPSRRLQMVHHADVQQGILLALRAENVSGEVFNIADDSAATLSEILRYVGQPVTAEMVARPVVDPWFGIVTTGKARRVLGFRPVYPTMWQAVDADAM